MDIWIENRFKGFFAWQFSERDRQLPGAKILIERIKSDFKYRSEWMYFRDDKKWLIHKSRFQDFFDLYFEMIKNVVKAQGEMNLDG